MYGVNSIQYYLTSSRYFHWDIGPELFSLGPIGIRWYGLASHGGGLGALIATFLYSRNKPQEPYLWLLDRIAIAAALCGFFIRIGNLFNSEIIGAPTTLPWAFIFEKVDNIPRHPVQLYESVTYGLIFVVLLTIYKKQRYKVKQGIITGLFLLLVFTARFFWEFVKARQASYSSNLPLSIGQLLSIPFLLAGIVLIIRAYRKQLSHSQGAFNNESG